MTYNLTELEEKALRATQLRAFPLNLHKIRENVSIILTEVGRYGFFNEYTTHSFEHVYSMLRIAEWVIPQKSKDLLTDGDYLFIVLSIYFHDIGLLISRDEFANRERNALYMKFLSDPPIPAQKYVEFKARIDQLPTEEGDKILYQEFVRHTHGQRVRAWIEGFPVDDSNNSKEIRKVIADLLHGLDSTVKRDIGLVCESHTIDDICDTGKYKISQPYGESNQEAVNLQYAAAILRACDLMHITKGRAPSVLYQLISPTDPISQVEWQKQNAVRTVRKKLGVDREGRVSADAPADTIEVHARFAQSEGFFGLTAYLVYAQRELQACHAAIARSEVMGANVPNFPWRYVDASGIEADGFLTESFGFTIDQQKILDLLTGHTLYNDTTVVIRELTQNSLDAIRLQASIDKTDSSLTGLIEIRWRSNERELTITDNGTGMSQDVIVNHLLKVGSSRYQDPKFKEKHPDFFSISRFGIGVLTAFMISDNVQITTCSLEDEKARRIDLRSVHGKYLIKLLDKVADREELRVFPHGTSVRLILRPTADLKDVLSISKTWLMFPRCRVTVYIDDEPPVNIGYKSPSEAVEQYISKYRPPGSARYSENYEVRELSMEGITVAFAVKRNRWFKDWSFVELDGWTTNKSRDDDVSAVECCTCVEGVGVQFDTPGFNSRVIVAIANAVGIYAPKTNVARSALEDTSERRQMISTLFKLYSKHISNEIQRLVTEEGYSLSRATADAPFMLSPLMSGSDSEHLSEAIYGIPLILAEKEFERGSMSVNDLVELGEYWTVDSPLFRSVETFIREAPTHVRARDLLKTLGSGIDLPKGLLVCNSSWSRRMTTVLNSKFEVAELSIIEKKRQITAKWMLKSNNSRRWITSSDIYNKVAAIDRRRYEMLTQAGRHYSNYMNYTLAIPDGRFQAGIDRCSACVVNDIVYVANGKLAEFMGAMINKDAGLDEYTSFLSFTRVVLQVMSWSIEDIASITVDDVEEMVGDPISRRSVRDASGDFVKSITSVDWVIFDPYAWDRREE